MITMSKVLAKWSYFAHNGNIYQIWYPNFVAIYHDSLAIDYMGLEWTINHLLFFTKATWWHEVKLSWGQKFKQSK
jgi:hypothetical protein